MKPQTCLTTVIGDLVHQPAFVVARNFTIESVGDEYDYVQEIARSSFGDMVNDVKRNQAFSDGIRVAIDKVHRRGEQVRLLDIGTGSGLLSMMAMRHGADVVTACEAFQPIADVARRVIRSNFPSSDCLPSVIAKGSTDMTVEDLGRSEPANVLVAEVFDTELIGEGALATFSHAVRQLTTANCIMIPDSARIYVQPVSGRLFRNWAGSALVGSSGDHCPRRLPLRDVQLRNLRPGVDYVSLSSPICVKRFMFSDVETLEYPTSTISKAFAFKDLSESEPHSVDALLFWWEAAMDQDERILLSNKHRMRVYSLVFSYSSVVLGTEYWRDHWMQAVLAPHSYVELSPGTTFFVKVTHDEFSWECDISLSGLLFAVLSIV